MSSDELLLLCEQMKHGNDTAFATLYEKLYAPLYRFVYTLSLSKEDSEDIVQDVFKRLPQILTTFHGGNVIAWLFTIARNRYYDSLKRTNRSQSFDEAIVDAQISIDDSQELDDMDAVSVSWLQSALAQLSVRERELLVLRYWRILDMKQIAAIVGKSHEAVRQEMSRIIKKLRVYYGQKK
jgi:RNA polymerase sigma-70 factor (ECF subfamily)